MQLGPSTSELGAPRPLADISAASRLYMKWGQMPKHIQLLKQIKNATAAIHLTIVNSEQKALLHGIEVTLNELMRQYDSDFYLEYIASGRRLVSEGTRLLIDLRQTVPDLPVNLRDDLNADLKSDIFDAEMRHLNQCLVTIVSSLNESRSGPEKAFFIEISDWQASLALHRLKPPDTPIERLPVLISPDSLTAYLRTKFPDWRNLEVTHFVSLDGGFSKRTILFETQDTVNGHRSMVIRAEQPVNLLVFDGSDVTKEFYSIKLMQNAGLPIAEPLWLEPDAGRLGTRFLVSRRASGRAYGGNMGSSEALSGEMIDSMFSLLIKIHGISLDQSDPMFHQSHFAEWLPYKTIEQVTRYYVTDYMDKLIERSEIDVTPQIVRGLKWLRANVPASDEPAVIVHADYALNNLLFNEHGISAILDWESSRFGDPADDIIWTHLNLADYLSMPQFLDRYKRVTGRDVSEFRLAYARIAKCVLNFIVFQRSLEAIDKYDATNINLCILAINYPGYFVSQFTSLIEEAEKCKRLSP
jgi:aminoglycoside phosphotransferase (APT) family kinase protein